MIAGHRRVMLAIPSMASLILPLIWAVLGVVKAIVVLRLVGQPDARHCLGERHMPARYRSFVILFTALNSFGARFRTARVANFSFEPTRGSKIRVLLVGVALVALVGTLTNVIPAPAVLSYVVGGGLVLFWLTGCNDRAIATICRQVRFLLPPPVSIQVVVGRRPELAGRVTSI